jgi:hypothetical protein
MNLHSLIHEIHRAVSGDLTTLKSRIIDSGLAGPELESGNLNQYYNLAYSHVWREFNRKCYNVDLTGLMVTPYDAGLRPRPPALSTLSNGPTTTTTTTPEPFECTYLQPNEVDSYLQPNQVNYYKYVCVHAHIGEDCNGDPVTIYIESISNTFDHTKTAYITSELSTTYNGYFIYNNVTYNYSNGVSSEIISYPYVGTNCDNNPVTIYTANSSFNHIDSAYTNSCLTTAYTTYFINNNNVYLYIGGIGVDSSCPTTTPEPTTTTTTTTPEPTTTTTTTTPEPTTTTTTTTPEPTTTPPP